MIQREREQGIPTLLVDAGNFATRTVQFEPWEKTTFMWDRMADLGYEVVTPGDLELVRGLEALKELYDRHPEIQVVSANLRDREGKQIFPDYAIVEKGGVKIGVTGVVNPVFYNNNRNRGIQKRDDFTFEDLQEALLRVVPDLRQKSDLVVVLLHDSPGPARRVINDVEGMDVVVVGHNAGYSKAPARFGNSLLIRPGTRGQYIHMLALTLDETTKEIVDYEGEGRKMGDGIRLDPSMDQVVREYELDYAQRKEEDQKRRTAESALAQGLEKYVGADMCARCHIEEYTAWAQTPHARAYQSLVDAEQEAVDECVQCHVVGFGEPSGYEMAWRTEKGKQATLVDSSDLRNVQCESCHGIGTFHGTVAMVKSPGEETCRTCHTGEFGEGFDYPEAVTKVH